ncbi:MAG: hypothetical protein DMG35_05285, partial [Acidobacteria bacterium]
MLSGGALLADLHGIAWPITTQSQETDPFAGGRRLGTVDFINEGPVPLDTPQGSELDGRLYTDLSMLDPRNPITPTEKFYIRTRVSEIFPDPTTWQVKVDGLVDRPLNLEVESLKKAAMRMGMHVMECAGNVRLARFALISAGNWTGVPISEILDGTKVRPIATRILISGFDRYAKESKTSVPGASWIFSLEQLNAARAFLATELNGQPLTKDHGAPVR